jgi:hypothetical protein
MITAGFIWSDGDEVTVARMNAMVGSAVIQNGAVASAMLANGSVTDGKLASNAVTEGKILNAAVTTAKLNDNAVTTAKIAGAAVDASKLSGAQTGAAPVFGVRAWVHFNGITGVSPANGSGNVASITKVGTGDYLINFAVALPHAVYAVSGAARLDDVVGGGLSNVIVVQKRGGVMMTNQCSVSVQSLTGFFVDVDRVFVMFVG